MRTDRPQERPREAPSRRLLVINPNTNPAVTNGIRDAALRVIAAGTTIEVVNPETGPLSIETPSDREAAVPRVIALVRDGLPKQHDAYVLGCFDDIGLFESRALAKVPVVGTCEAGIAAARAVAGRFSIITTVHSAVPGIRRLLARYGAGDICTVRAAGIGVAAAAVDEADAEARILHAVRAALDEDGAKAILLGSGGLSGRANDLRRRVQVPVIDGVLAAVKMAEGLVDQLASTK